MWRVHFLCVVACCAVLAGCKQQGFECGTPASDDPDVITRCDRSQEVCICATRSCAKRVPVPEHPPSGLDAGVDAAVDPDAICDSGLRYVEKPFAHKDWAGKCVPPEHKPNDDVAILESDERGQACDPGEVRDAMMSEPEPEPEDSGMDSGPPDAAIDSGVDGGDGDSGSDAGDSGEDMEDAS